MEEIYIGGRVGVTVITNRVTADQQVLHLMFVEQQ